MKARFIKRKTINRTTKTAARKLPYGLHHGQRPTAKCRSHKRYKFYRKNHANSKKIWRTVEDTTGHHFGLIGNAINLSNNTFTKETF